MNILPKKSWHVRTRKNIEKVRQDEAKAREEQLEKAQRADIAAQERRMKKLRTRLNGEEESSIQKSTTNFFPENAKGDKNKAYEYEKRKEREDYEKKMGILTYLGGSQVKSESPWYLLEPEARKQRKFQDEVRIQELDPLNDLRAFQKTEEQLKKKKAQYEKLPARHHKQDEHHEQVSSLKDAKLQKLRNQRLKREAKESAKAKQIFSSPNSSSRSLADERTLRYHQQFNPHLTKKN